MGDESTITDQHRRFLGGKFPGQRGDLLGRYTTDLLGPGRRVFLYVFLDDLCGSGEQATNYCTDIVSPLKAANPDVEVLYYVLFATIEGLEAIRNLGLFDQADSVVELDETFRAFSSDSRFYSHTFGEFDKANAKRIA